MEATPLISLSDYSENFLDGVKEILDFVVDAGKGVPLTLDRFGPFSQRRLEVGSYPFRDTEILQFSNGKILVCIYAGEYHHSEVTTEPASVIFIGYTPIKETDRADQG